MVDCGISTKVAFGSISEAEATVFSLFPSASQKEPPLYNWLSCGALGTGFCRLL